MIFKRIDIDPENNVYMNCYLHEEEQSEEYPNGRPAVAVCPGGGYTECFCGEADPVALKYLAEGFNAFVVYYSLQDTAAFPKPLTDLSKAIKIIRQNAEEFGVLPNKIAVLGFSAGGHLTASLGTLWNNPEIARLSDCEKGENKPNALILCYPVITTRSWMKPHLKRLIGQRDFADTEKLLDCSKNVGPHTPPSFLVHTFMDNAVSVEESLDFARALDKNNIPFEMHIFPNGNHGICMGDRQRLPEADPSFSKWPELSILWLKRVFQDDIKPDPSKRARQC